MYGRREVILFQIQFSGGQAGAGGQKQIFLFFRGQTGGRGRERKTENFYFLAGGTKIRFTVVRTT
jgi:hypothetical protein